MRFAKYHGLGNDFLVVDLRTASASDAAAAQDPATVIKLCDRQFGVGGDGVLAVLPSAVADARMRVLNSDGSEAEMCGNGIRCVAIELATRGGFAGRASLAIETAAGVLDCAVDGSSVTVAMGAPRLTRGELPMTGPADERCIEQPLAIAPEPAHPTTAVSMGNPHAIAFVASRAEAWRLARGIGPQIEHHAWFPRRTNVEFAHVVARDHLELVVWERGCGITNACGTGACATVVAAVLTDRASAGAPVRVELPGGALEITVLADLSNVLMKGPAVHVFDADVALDALVARPVVQPVVQ